MMGSRTGPISALGASLLGLAIIFSAAGSAPAPAAPAETVVGTWLYQDKALKEKIVIKKTGTELIAVIESKDGVTRKVVLAEETSSGRKRYTRKDSKSGEYYQVEPSGDLGSYDRKGLIRTAKKMETTPPGKPDPDYCYKIGYQYGRAVSLAIVSGKSVEKTVKIVIPEECKGLPETKRGIEKGKDAVKP